MISQISLTFILHCQIVHRSTLVFKCPSSPGVLGLQEFGDNLNIVLSWKSSLKAHLVEWNSSHWRHRRETGREAGSAAGGALRSSTGSSSSGDGSGGRHRRSGVSIDIWHHYHFTPHGEGGSRQGRKKRNKKNPWSKQEAKEENGNTKNFNEESPRREREERERGTKPTGSKRENNHATKREDEVAFLLWGWAIDWRSPMRVQSAGALFRVSAGKCGPHDRISSTC